jgi:hypothetical protein
VRWPISSAITGSSCGRLPDLHHPHRSWGPGRYGDTGPFYGLLPVTAWDEALVEETPDFLAWYERWLLALLRGEQRW